MAIRKLDIKTPFLTIEEFFGSALDDCRCVMLTGQMVTVIRKAIYPSMSWRTRFGQRLNPTLIQEADEEDRALLLNVLEDLDYRLTGEPMANCMDSVAQSLDEIAGVLGEINTTIYNKDCGGDGGCNPGFQDVGFFAGQTEGGQIMYGSSEPSEIEEGVGNPPDGFADWDAYFAHKCRVANWLVDGMIQACWNVGAITVFEITALAGILGLGWAGLLVFPPAAISVAITAIIALGVSVAVLVDLGDYITDNRDEWVCMIYNSASTQVVLDNVMAKIDEWLETVALAASLHWAVKAIAAALLVTDAVNKLFEYNLISTYPDADCSTCGEEEDVFSIVPNFGILQSGDFKPGSTAVVRSQRYGGNGVQGLGLYNVSGQCWGVTVVAVTGVYTPRASINYPVEWYNCQNTYSHNNFSESPVGYEPDVYGGSTTNYVLVWSDLSGDNDIFDVEFFIKETGS